MTDRELLELAARAAGIDLGEFWTPHLGEHHAHYWNPMRDDGDAFRLAVKMNFEIDIGVLSTAISGILDSQKEMAVELHRGNPIAATRRAIVRAAAEIARVQT